MPKGSEFQTEGVVTHLLIMFGSRCWIYKHWNHGRQRLCGCNLDKIIASYIAA